MERSAWRRPSPFDEVCRRAGGRRRFNSVRQARAIQRQGEVLRLLRQSRLAHGWQAHAARQLGVSPATISRDVVAIFRRLAGQQSWVGVVGP